MNDKKKVLIVHNLYRIPGGEDSVAASEKKLLEDKGHEVFLYTRNNSEIDKAGPAGKALLPFVSVFNPRTYREIKRLIKEKGINIVHVHNTLTLISPAVYYAAKSCKVPVVQTIHNFRLMCPNGVFYRDGHICEDCADKGLGYAIKHSCYRGSRLQTIVLVMTLRIHRMLKIYGKLNYICLTEFNRDKLLASGLMSKDRVFVKPNFAAGSGKDMPYGSRPRQFVYAGRIEEIKGIMVLLEAWKLMGEDAPELIICGTGEAEEKCRKYVSDNSLTRIDIKGHVPGEELRQIIGSSRALILPTLWYEGFPMTIVEAFSEGTPVICSDIGNAGSIVKEGVTGYKFKAGDPGELASVVRRCLDDSNGGNDGKDIGASVKDEYLKSYTEEANYVMLREIYDKAAKRA